MLHAEREALNTSGGISSVERDVVRSGRFQRRHQQADATPV
jgi:hypothetical protein